MDREVQTKKSPLTYRLELNMFSKPLKQEQTKPILSDPMDDYFSDSLQGTKENERYKMFDQESLDKLPILEQHDYRPTKQSKGYDEKWKASQNYRRVATDGDGISEVETRRFDLETSGQLSQTKKGKRSKAKKSRGP